MAKTSRSMTGAELNAAKACLLDQLQLPAHVVRASFVRQFLTCGKRNCRCRRGFKHGPFYYLVQCRHDGAVTKFLLKTPEQRRAARAGIAAYRQFQKRLDDLSRLNTELLRRSEEFSP